MQEFQANQEVKIKLKMINSMKSSKTMLLKNKEILLKV